MPFCRAAAALAAVVARPPAAPNCAAIQRFVPNIIHYYTELEAQRKAALAAITPHDKRIAQARTLPSVLQALDPAKVNDPDLAEHIRLSKVADTDTMAHNDPNPRRYHGGKS